MAVTYPVPLSYQARHWLKRQTPTSAIALAVTTGMLGFHVFTGEVFMLPLYAVATYALRTISKYWARTPKPIRVLSLGSVSLIFAWAAMTCHASAQALLFNKLLQALTTAMTAWGVY